MSDQATQSNENPPETPPQQTGGPAPQPHTPRKEKVPVRVFESPTGDTSPESSPTPASKSKSKK
ncbi:hypothetical protein JB92DRAFT_3123286 [Gautieria morchelliformis]|nr:hypothetical protein JB92DRAFT_3123286 [Gautieria morchelliformis]